MRDVVREFILEKIKYFDDGRGALKALDAEREVHAKGIADLRRRLADVDEAHATEIDDLLERIADLTAQLQDER